MNVVRLFPEKETPEIEQIARSPARTERGLRRGIKPAQPSPVDVLARAAGERRAASPLTPTEVIARSLERPASMDRFWAIWMAHQTALRQRSLRLSGGNRADAEDALATSAALRAALAAARLSRHMEAVCVAWACDSQSLHSLDGMSHTKQKQLAQNIALALKAPLTHRFSTQFSRACGNWASGRGVR